MFLCLHTHLLLCSAQHCPPAPSCLPTLVPPGQRFHRTLIRRPRWCRCRRYCCCCCCWSCCSSPSPLFCHGWQNTFHLPSVLSTLSSFPSHIPNLWMASLPKPGLLWHCKEPHGPVDYQAEAGYGTVPGALAVCRGHLADVQQRLVVQPQDVQSLQVLL